MERCAVVATLAGAEAARHGGPVKCDEAGGSREERQDRRQVAVADERLARTTGLAGIEQREQLHASVAAANANQRRNRRVRPRAPDGAGAQCRRSRDELLPREDGFVEDRLESEAPQLVDAAIELRPIERTCRRHDGDAVAWRERARLQHHAKRAISAAIA